MAGIREPKAIKIMPEERPRDFVEDTILRHCGPIYIIPSLQEAGAILFNASFGLIDTGQRKLLITCHHVWEFFQNLRQQYPLAEVSVNLGSGPGSVISDAEVIGTDPDLDIAILDPKFQAHELGPLAYFKVPKWPISKISRGEIICFAGFPECGRSSSDQWGAFGSSYFGLRVGTVSETKAILLNDDEDSSGLIG